MEFSDAELMDHYRKKCERVEYFPRDCEQ